MISTNQFGTNFLLLTVFLAGVFCIEKSPPEKHEITKNATTIEASNLISSHIPTNGIQRKLKVCVKSGPGIPQNDFVELPTFVARTKEYSLEKQQLDKDGDFFICKNGQKPVESHKTITKHDVDQELEVADLTISQVLRSINVLMESGYISVGIDETAHYYAPDEYCIESIIGHGTATIIEFKTCPISKERPIFPKCCPLGMFLKENECVALPKDETWNPNYFDEKTRSLISIGRANPVFTSPLLQCHPVNSTETWVADQCTFEFYRTTENRLVFVGASRKWEFIASNITMCLDRFVHSEHPTTTTILFHCAGSEGKSQTEINSQARISMLYMVNMYIGALFHLLTTTVYLITWQKQNIHGKTLSSLTASLFFMQIFLGTAHLLGQYKNLRNPTFCLLNSIGGQYFMIAAFSWHLLVNIDLWRTFRSIRTSSNSTTKRFLTFSSIGWGLPLTITVISIILNFTFTCRTSGFPIPEYGEHYCFVSPWSQGFYVYYIISILIGLYCIFAGLTLFSLYSFKKDTGNIRSSKRTTDHQNVLLFLKLGVVMGLTWVFEVIGWAVTKDDDTENHVLWIIFDLYNSLSAILIFIIFVCKKTTFNLLEQSVPCLKGISAAMSKITGETTSDNTTSTAVGNGSTYNGGTSLKVHYTKREEVSCDNPGYE